MVDRDLGNRLLASARTCSVVTVSGPRRSGKAVLCRSVFFSLPYRNLAVPNVRRFAQEDPLGFLAQHPEGAILDEMPCCPDMLPHLVRQIRLGAASGNWILIGSQNSRMFAVLAQSLEGHIAEHRLLPLTRNEIVRFPAHPRSLDAAIIQGGYPGIPEEGVAPGGYLDDIVAELIERDVRAVATLRNQVCFQRFLALCAGRTARPLNYSALAADAGVSQPTAKFWLLMLEASFIVFRLPAYAGRTRKRLAKAPKLHFYDSGLACRLLGIGSAEQLSLHPLRGALFESWVVSEVMRRRAHDGRTGGLHHVRDLRGTEVALVIDRPDGVLLVDTKSGQTVTPDMLQSLHQARMDWGGMALVGAVVVYGGNRSWEREGTEIVPWASMLDGLS